MHPPAAVAMAGGAETELVRAARAGDKQAFGALLVRHRPLLLALCRRALGDHDLAEDAAQEAALQALLGLDQLRRPDRFGPWLAGIGLNICRSWLRHRVRDAWSWEALAGGQFSPDLVDTSPCPEDLVEAAEMAEHLRRAVTALPPGQRSTVALVYLAGLTYAETAAVLQIELGAVKTRLHKARRTLQRRLCEEWKESNMDKHLSRRTLTKATGAAAGLAAAGHLGTGMERAAAAPPWVEMRVIDVRRRTVGSETARQHVVVLADGEATHQLPIWVGEFEATAIALQLSGVATPRPMTHMFAAALLQASGGSVREVRINKLTGSVFYAEVMVAGAQGVMVVDARPSDALSLALLTQAPIRVASDVLQTAQGAKEARVPSGAEYTGAAAIAAEATASWDKPRDTGTARDPV